MENPVAYLPMDRRHALVRGQALPDRAQGAALFADISGFTPLTEALVRELGPQRGAEELTRYLNLVYDAVIEEVHRYGGSVIAFAGDAITCWLDGDAGVRATACALAMQQTMQQFSAIHTPAGNTVALAMKAAIAVGAARRFLVGDPAVRVIDALAGETLVRLANAEHQAQRGETVVDETALPALAGLVEVGEVRHVPETEQTVAVVTGFQPASPEVNSPATAPQAQLAAPWPSLPADAIPAEEIRPWLLPQVYERLRQGLGGFLAELRPTVALFLRFGGIDYDHDEAAGAKLDAYIRWVLEVVARYEGTLIDLNIGDKGSYLYINFGAPVAHEDNAERAAATALALRNQPEQLSDIGQVQIGISQGRMRAGAYGGTNHRTYGVLGDEVNMAARLMMAAKPGQILVSLAAQQSIGRGFALAELPPIRVKGKSEPAVIFALTDSQQTQGFQLTKPEYTLPMVGREAELALLTAKLTKATQGQGQWIGVVGEAGLGKSRLVAALVELAAAQGFALYGGECESYGVNSSYLVWQPIWQGILGINTDWRLSRQLYALQRKLRAINPALVARLPLLGAVLNIEIPDNDLTLSLDAKLRKSSLEALLVDCLRAEARQTPLVIVLEACQWLDALSQDLLETIGLIIADLPVLVVCAYRPQEEVRLHTSPIRALPYYTEILCAPLTTDEAVQFAQLKVAQLLGHATEVPLSLVQRLTAQAEGNPFYLEELLTYLHYRGVDFQNSAALDQVELPDSLQRLVLSLVDQLSESQKITVKVASVIGRVFREAWLYGAYPELGDPTRIHTDLERLRQQEIMVREPSDPELLYLFRQVITQGVTYESLPYAMKAVLHEQIAQFIEQHYPDTLDQQLDLLAYHYAHSPNVEKQRFYLRKAGEAAQAAYANPAAIDYYQRVLPLVPQAEQAELLLKLGQVLELVGQWHEASERYQQALEIAGRLAVLTVQAQAQRALGWLLRKQGDYPAARQWMEQARTNFMQIGDPAGVSYLLADIGEVYRLQTKFEEAHSYYAESLQLAATVATPREQMAVRAYALKGAGTVATWQGDYAAAQTLNEESLTIRRELGDKPGVATMLNNLAIVAGLQQDMPGAYQLNEESLAVFRELGDLWSLGTLLNNQAVVASALGDYAEARRLLQESLSIRRQLGDKAGLAFSLNTLADVVLDEGDYLAAPSLLAESLRLNRELGDQTAIAYLMEDYAGLAAAQDQPVRAMRLAGFAAALRQTVGAPLPPTEQERVDRMLAPARRVLAADAIAMAWATGASLALPAAVEYALSQADDLAAPES
ncbi:MAG: tetratricopeptide repeat protein [Caldilineaceae bacterium]|nr:tetratricopeptide repeat protein [Caldilineaceae bacterium]